VQKLIIVGAGGLGSEVAAAVKCMNTRERALELLGFCDDDGSKKGSSVEGVPVLGIPEQVNGDLAIKPGFICAIGNNRIRQAIVRRLLDLAWNPVRVIDPSVISAESARIGPGSYVAAGSVLSPFVEIASHVIVNFNCSITHNVKLDDFSQVAPGGGVMGFGALKVGAFVASNGVVAPGVTIGQWATLGACSFAMRNVEDGATAVGVPARVVFRSPSRT
jgi:sugar O-acyltransferase (sialic acid O-acetyltransferase NeuD family)